VLYLSGKHELAATVLAHTLLDFFGMDNVLASKLSYHALALLVFKRNNLPEDIANVLKLIACSLDNVVACMTRRLLKRAA